MPGYLKDGDRGYEALLKRIFGFGHPQVVTGILEAQGAETKKLPPKIPPPKDGELPTLIQVAQWMEFGFTFTAADGTEVTVPAHSYIRAWFDAAEPRMRDKLARLMHGFIASRGKGRTKQQILELLGQVAVSEIQQRIADGIPPPLAQSTIDRKGSSKPLIASGQLRGAVSYDVRERK